MASSARPRLTPAQGRRFAFTLAGAFAALAAVGAWRGRPRTTAVMGTLAGVCLLAGLFVPTRLGPVERAWMRLGELLSRVTTPIALAVMYLLVVTPMGLLRRTLGRSPLTRDPGAPSYWITRQPREREAARRALERQF
ncbi:MAG TPA: SxtJ family membrane protein [Gemmatimonadaceae bacterium]|jgi:hypothetical protein|nr:SxtJ family membrane protein [Gemmatimonadaceae bacterium]